MVERPSHPPTELVCVGTETSDGCGYSSRSNDESPDYQFVDETYLTAGLDPYCPLCGGRCESRPYQRDNTSRQ
jgi:hypothetical protein